MTHEFKDILEVAQLWQKENRKSVLATVVCLEGSSYRGSGVQMLIGEHGAMVGAVSGGCVEKEVQRQAESVFTSGIPKVMTYDGRYRLGCEGVLYILLEPLVVTNELFQAAQTCFANRKVFQSKSYFQPLFSESDSFGTILEIEGKMYNLRPSFTVEKESNLEIFKRVFTPLFQLYIFGAEHDAVQLCDLGSKMGWEVHIIASPDEQKSIDYFKGATTLSSPIIQNIDVSAIDHNTAVVIMSHSLTKDLQYLITLQNTNPSYIGLLGSSKRRERLFSEYMNHASEVSFEFLERIHGPVGLDIGAITPIEIAVSIIAEIISVTRNVEVMPLREKMGRIHG
ncbi:XdhC family protein [Flavobacterium adhaerens]|uniref:XdhC family protein n=1 Tax=Flavobacterium adhaerens TaxID=3149043 RepID=UPI0032B5E7CE